MTKEVNCRFIPLYKTFLLRIDLEEDIVEELNVHLDHLQERTMATSEGIGKIRHTRPLHILMQPNDPSCVRFSNSCLGISYEYMKRYFEILKWESPTDRMPEIDEMWSVHSREGDYNILHAHETKTLMGCSLVTWTKVPEQIADTEKAELNNKFGDYDGFLALIVGDRDVYDEERLKFSGYYPIKPEVGALYVFPSWVQHLIWPFFGEGERRTVAVNVNLAPLTNSVRQGGTRFHSTSSKYGYSDQDQTRRRKIEK